MSLPADTIRTLVTGEHSDPFSVLGPHAEADGALAIRAFLPDARAVEVVSGEGGAPHRARRLHPAGLWEARLDAPTPVPRHGYRVGVPRPGYYAEAVNTDSTHYGGSNVGNGPGIRSEPVPWHGQPHSVTLSLPPLGALLFRWTGP